MTHKAICALIATIFAATIPAHAHHRINHPQAVSHCVSDNSGHETCPGREYRTSGRRIASDANGNRSDPRPAAWCGWQMRQWLGVADRAFNLARKWAHYGSPAHGPRIGAIVVWPHHVGLLTGHNSEGWIVKSGNDGHRVRERVRSLRGAIAFRWPPQRFAGL